MMLRKIFFTVIAIGFLSTPALGNEEVFPFLAQTINDKINVRAGGNINFERLCQLNKGETLVVVAKEYGWYKIQIPLKAQVYISKKYVVREQGALGKVTAKDVNVRALPNITASVVGRMTTDDKVYILEELPEWYKIEPTEKTYGWIAQDMVAFTSQDIASYPFSQLVLQLKQLEEERIKKEEAVSFNPEKKEEPLTVTIQGLLQERSELVESDSIRYLLTENQIPSYYLQAPVEILKQLVNQHVIVEGRIQSDLKDYSYPVLVVQKIGFLL